MDAGSAGSGFEHTDKRSLRTLQSLLVRSLARLIEYAYSRGYELTFGEAFVQSPRKVEVLLPTTCPKCKAPNEIHFKGYAVDRVHMPASLHQARLAVDMNLFVDGAFITNGDDPAWAALGNYWEQLDPACCWGGRFKDANHFSVTFGGKK